MSKNQSVKERDYDLCHICQSPTEMTGTKLCDECWEMERRIHQNPSKAQKIIDKVLDSGETK